MRPIANFTLHAALAAALTALASAGPAEEVKVLSGEVFVKLPKASPRRMVQGGQLEIQSWQWGATQRVSKVEKRQHGWMPSSKLLDRGAVRLKVKFPWLDCRVGAVFPDALLQNDTGRYELTEVIVSSCARDSVILNYAKVTVLGWDPATKRE